jgi:uncharacterized protein (TIGR02597 family)
MAATATTEPVGYNTVSLLANSDTYVSVPFQRPAAFVGQVASFSSNAITVAGAPSWASSQFVYASGSQSNTYYAFIRSGAKEGNYYTVTANGTNTLTVDLAGDTLTGLAPNDSISVIPYWSVSTIFPAADVGTSFDATTSVLTRKTEIFLLDLNSTGRSISTASTLFFFNGNWRKVGRPLTDNFNDMLITPDEFIIIRNNTATPRQLCATGNVITQKFSVVLRTLSSGKQDNVISVPRPIGVSLNDLGLVASGAFSPSPSVLGRTDELFVFDNTVPQKSRSASATFFYYNNGWRKVGQPLTTDFGASEIISAGTGIIIRKASSSSGNAQAWINTPTY